MSESNEKRDAKGLTEAEFLAAYREKAHRYPRPFLTADCVILSPCKDEEGEYELLLIRRGNHPFLGCLALPGGFASEGETMEDSAARELMEETGTKAPLSLLGIYSAPGRDPRGWVVSGAYLALIPGKPPAVAGDDAAATLWVRVCLEREGDALHLTLPDGAALRLCAPDYRHPDLAFDHGVIIADALKRIGAEG